MSDGEKRQPHRPDGAGAADESRSETRFADDREALMRLATVVAHQLKSPLSSVQTVLASLLGGFTGPLDPRQRWLLGKAMERCSKGVNLVQDLLRLRSIENLDDDSLGPVNLVAAFTAAIDEVRDAAAEQELVLETSIELSDADAAWIRGEAATVREIFKVLLDNAVKYTPKGGHVSARLSIHDAEAPGESASLRAEILDSGIGIPPEGYQQLFQDFYRAPNAKKLATEGSGLGLSFAARAARRLDGRVHLEPGPEGGVRAVVDLPQRLDYAEGTDRQAGVGLGDTLRERNVSRRVVIVGGVTAGSKAAARIMRLDANADVTIVDRGRFLAYSGCGLPYYISGVVREQRALLETPLGQLRDPAFFHKLKNVRALDFTEAVTIDRQRKRLVVRNLLDGRQRQLPYDTLILATGARPVIPDFPGGDLKGIHTLYGVEDAEAIRSRLDRPRAKDVVIAGAGLLGCQICDSVSMRGARLTLVEERASILDPLLDEELSALVRGHLETNGTRVLCNQAVDSFEGDERVEAVHLKDGSRLACDFVIVSLGRRPEVELARQAGLPIGASGAIRVDRYLRTDDPDILAAGDCAEQVHAVTGEAVWIPGAVPATMQGRVAANNACGLQEESPPVAGTTVVRLFDWTVGRTGLTERDAREMGLDPLSVLIPGPDRAHFIPASRNFLLKLIAERESGRVLGAQGVGPGEVAKRIDVLATALATGMDVDALARLHLAYSPSYSMAMDNVIAAANVLRNKRDGRFRGMSPVELRQRMLAGDAPLMLDVRQPVEYGETRLRASLHIPLGSLRSRLHELPRDQPIVTVCSLGLRSYEASLILTANGFKDVWVLDGGLEAWPYPIEQLA